MNAYEPALKVRPLPPLPGKERPGHNGPPSNNSLTSSSSSVSSRQSFSFNNNSASPPNSAAPNSPRELSEEETRNRIVQEILSTEDAYVKSLGTITTIFLPPIKAIIKDKYISEADFRSLFSNIEVILQFNSEFYKELKTCIDNWGPMQLLGPIFLKLAPFLKMYTAYASNYNVALEVLRKLRDMPKTSDLLEDLRKKAGNDIEAFLIKPVQRIPRYELLLRDLLKHTVDSHPDYKNIEDSLNKMKDIADHINSFVRNQQNSQKVLDLGMQNFVAPHRQFVRDGIVTAEVMATSKRYQLQFALFSDILIKNENPKKKIKPHKAKYQWPLKLVWIKDHPNSIDFSFEIIGPDNAYIVYCATAEEKAGWMQDLLGYILAALKYKKDDQRRYGKFSYNDGSMYEGWWSDGTRHGVGTWTHMGNKYVGEWKNNKKNGQGTMSYFTASSYKGSWKDDAPSGVGTFTDPYGNVYEGEWLNGKKDGRGALKYKNGDVYEGSFKEDMFDGFGNLKMTNGMRYEGNWQRGQFHGKGTLVHPSGKKYDGQWQYGLKHGTGTLVRVNGDNYVGEWANNKRHGQGTLDQTNSDGTVFTGTFFEGKYDGNGTVKYRDGSKYEGQWRAGERHGKGTFYFYGSSSLKYTGEWVRDAKSGQGQLVLVNGSRYEGSFKDDRPHGPGVFIDINGTTIEGKWFEGVLEGKCTLKINKPLAEQENGASSSSSKKSKDYVMVLSGSVLGSTIEIAESKAIKFPTSMPRAPEIQALTLPSFCMK